MRFVLLVLILGSIKLATAGWGAFRVITPENMSENDIEVVQVSKNDDYIEFCLIDSNGNETSKELVNTFPDGWMTQKQLEKMPNTQYKPADSNTRKIPVKVLITTETKRRM